MELVRTLRAQMPLGPATDSLQPDQAPARGALYEVLDAIAATELEGRLWDHLEEELGDLLFQVAFHATLAAEAGQVYLADVSPAGDTTSW